MSDSFLKACKQTPPMNAVVNHPPLLSGSRLNPQYLRVITDMFVAGFAGVGLDGYPTFNSGDPKEIPPPVGRRFVLPDQPQDAYVLIAQSSNFAVYIREGANASNETRQSTATAVLTDVERFLIEMQVGLGCDFTQMLDAYGSDTRAYEVHGLDSFKCCILLQNIDGSGGYESSTATKNKKGLGVSASYVFSGGSDRHTIRHECTHYFHHMTNRDSGALGDPAWPNSHEGKAEFGAKWFDLAERLSTQTTLLDLLVRTPGKALTRQSYRMHPIFTYIVACKYAGSARRFFTDGTGLRQHADGVDSSRLFFMERVIGDNLSKSIQHLIVEMLRTSLVGCDAPSDWKAPQAGWITKLAPIELAAASNGWHNIQGVEWMSVLPVSISELKSMLPAIGKPSATFRISPWDESLMYYYSVRQDGSIREEVATQQFTVDLSSTDAASLFIVNAGAYRQNLKQPGIGPTVQVGFGPGASQPLRSQSFVVARPSMQMPAMSSIPASGYDVTFFVSSDLHYGVVDKNGVNIADAHANTIDDMNALPGQAYPGSIGGTVAQPRGVVLIGDLIDNGNDPIQTPAAWAQFVQHFGVNGEGRCKFPVYEGYGNHDGHAEFSPRVKTPLVMQVEVKKRNAQRLANRLISNVSENGKHYSWDWDTVHFVQLNLYPGNAIPSDAVWFSGDPQNSLDFLAKDLQTRVGNSGRPVVLLFHYPVDDETSFGYAWWTTKEKRTFYDAIKGYNVVLLISGHTHSTRLLTWQLDPKGPAVNFLNDGNLGTGYIAVRITPGRVAMAQRSKGKWTEFSQTLTI